MLFSYANVCIFTQQYIFLTRNKITTCTYTLEKVHKTRFLILNVNIKISFLCDVTPCSLVEVQQSFT